MPFLSHLAEGGSSARRSRHKDHSKCEIYRTFTTHSKCGSRCLTGESTINGSHVFIVSIKADKAPTVSLQMGFARLSYSTTLTSTATFASHMLLQVSLIASSVSYTMGLGTSHPHNMAQSHSQWGPATPAASKSLIDQFGNFGLS